jgi:hypothetical protein
VNAVERAAKVYEREECSGTFRSDLEAHLLNGFAISRPDYFVMGRPVIRSADPRLIVDPWHKFHSSDCDTWHVFLFAGNIARAWAFLPWPLPFMSFERRNRLRFYSMSAIQRLSSQPA